MAGQGLSSWRHVTTGAAIMGLVFQAMMAAVMLPMPLGTQSALADAGPDVIVICTPTGLKQISFDASGNAVEKTVPGSKCPVCAALAAVVFAMPAVDGVVPVPVTAGDAGRPANEFLPFS
jgi:hypothetical protein